MDKLTVRFNLSISIFVVDYRKQYWIILIKFFFQISPVWFSVLFPIIYDISFNSNYSLQHNVSEKWLLWIKHTKKKPSSTHGCGRVDIPGIGIYPIISSKRDKAFFLHFNSELLEKNLAWIERHPQFEIESEVAQSCLTLCDPMDYQGVYQATRLLRPWDSPGKNTGVGCHLLLQGIFPTQGLNLGLPHRKQTL